MAETCNQYLKKGSKVLVEGRLTADPATGAPRIWNGQDGKARSSFDVSAQTVRFLSSRSDAGGSGVETAGITEEQSSPAGDENEIPF
jgi:single-strand DNA-binding protein